MRSCDVLRAQRRHRVVLGLVPGLLLVGLGLGGMLTPSVNVVQSSFPEEMQGEISGLSRSISNLGSSFGTAIAGTILVSVVALGTRSYAVAMIVLDILLPDDEKRGGATNKLKYEQIQMLARCGPYHGGVCGIVRPAAMCSIFNAHPRYSCCGWVNFETIQLLPLLQLGGLWAFEQFATHACRAAAS
jgi:MFS family permease